MIRVGWRKYLHMITEVPFTGAIFGFFVVTVHILPCKVSANLTAWLGRTIGPWLKKSKLAYKNLKFIYPHKSEAEIQTIIRDMWDNLGRTVGEYPHLTKFTFDDFQIDGGEILKNVIQNNQPAILVGAHLANWEMILVVSRLYGATVSSIYRPANNIVVRWLVEMMRRRVASYLIHRGPAGGRQTYAALKKNHCIAMLTDHKLTGGVVVPFMGHPVATAAAPATFGARLRCPIIPVQVKRLGKTSKFYICFYPPIAYPDTGNNEQDIYHITAEVNRHIESWIEEAPGQWFWLHKRWGKILQ
jgi:KDO2-lipid IV(A) lauroyltransferase